MEPTENKVNLRNVGVQASCDCRIIPIDLFSEKFDTVFHYLQKKIVSFFEIRGWIGMRFNDRVPDINFTIKVQISQNPSVQLRVKKEIQVPCAKIRKSEQVRNVNLFLYLKKIPVTIPD